MEKQTSFQFKPDQFITSIMMSKKKHILVEGSSDKETFTYLIEHLSNVGVIHKESNIKIVIESVDCIKFCENIPENSKKVEFISQKASSQKNLFCVIDREYRYFKINKNCVKDNLRDNKISEKLFITDGHSLENYFFDKSTLFDSLDYVATSCQLKKSKNLFDNNYGNIFDIACAFSYLLKELDISWERISSLIKFDWFSLENNLFRIKLEEVKRDFENNKMDENIINKFVHSYPNVLKLFKNSDKNVKLRYCHAHFTQKLVIKYYEAILRVVSNGNNEKNIKKKIQKEFNYCNEKIIKNILAKNWVKNIKDIDELPNLIINIVDYIK